MPPTPTPYPTIVPSSVPFSAPHVVLWDFTDDAIQAWAFAHSWTPVLQGLIVLGLVAFGLFMVISFLRNFTNEDTGTNE